MGADQFFDRNAAIASALDWWRDVGVDALVQEDPRDWLAPLDPAVAIAAEVSARIALAHAQPVVPPMPRDLPGFLEWRLGPDAPDAGWPGNRLFAQGPVDAALMIVIEMPERDDLAAGQLLSGAVGQLFDRMLAAIGLGRQSVQIVPMCTARPTTGRVPNASEPALAAALGHYVALTGPRQVLVFGNAASRALTGMDIAAARGALRALNQQASDLSPIDAQLVASYHPRFLLERPAAKPEAWKDLQMLIRGRNA